MFSSVYNQAKNFTRVQQCIDAGADVNLPNPDGFAPLLMVWYCDIVLGDFFFLEMQIINLF